MGVAALRPLFVLIQSHLLFVAFGAVALVLLALEAAMALLRDQVRRRGPASRTPGAMELKLGPRIVRHATPTHRLFVPQLLDLWLRFREDGGTLSKVDTRVQLLLT